jgi:hypothetical protein
LEFINVEVAGEVGELLLETRLGVGNGLVVDGRADVFQDEVEEQAGGQVADGFEIGFKVALERGDGVGAAWRARWDARRGPPGSGLWFGPQLIV